MRARPRIVIVVWLALVGADFALNAALFARLYADGGPFFVSPSEAFRRIPLGYAAFLILAAAVVELEARLAIRDLGAGLRLGLVGGAALGASWGLGLYSIATLSAAAALGFAVIWFVLFIVAAAVTAVALGRPSLRALAAGVIGADLVGFAAVVALQSFGVLPTVTP